MQLVALTWISYDFVEALLPWTSMWKGEVNPHLNLGMFCLLRLVLAAMSDRMDSSKSSRRKLEGSTLTKKPKFTMSVSSSCHAWEVIRVLWCWRRF